ncbi:MAG: pentapeptide repeat-containing protein [Candidatus Hodarchaeales archaeon]|jgi:hypothetical protein
MLTKQYIKEKIKRKEPLCDIDFTGIDLTKVDFTGMNLTEVNFTGINLEQANFTKANLYKATFYRATLIDANFSEANLNEACFDQTNLLNANLKRTNSLNVCLRGANLYGANFEGANLEFANLLNTNFTKAKLANASLKGADLPAPSVLLLADWGNLSDKTTTALMRLDADNHPEGETLFDIWATSGHCPYLYYKTQRVVNFKESKKLWSPGPAPTMYEAMCMILDEKCPGWNKY